ncbi:glycerate kinase [Microbacterium sp.]|uniref:glycerate kinase n=1 Tax=Microbacterium sp. TaxID=51671 RepID=UPI0039E625BC
MRTVVLAPDSFKGSASASAVAEALATGWRSQRPHDRVLARPMADGGEGTLAAFAAATPEIRYMPIEVCGPDGGAVDAAWLLLPDGTGVVELASTSGIEVLSQGLRPWDAGTTGFGQAIAAALDHGVTRLVLGIGSSASTDGGAGMLTALGARFADARGRPIASGARGLQALAAVDLDGLRPPPEGGATVLTDVTNPLLGPHGAAAVFGPQKGLDGAGVVRADAALARLAALVPGDPAAPGAGAAGGTGFALGVWGAQLVPGASRVAELVGLAGAVAAASVVVTGEGAFDGQSAAGKVPGFVAALAAAERVPVALVAGRIDADADVSGFVASVSLTELAGSAEAALADPQRWLRRAGAELARALP